MSPHYQKLVWLAGGATVLLLLGGALTASRQVSPAFWIGAAIGACALTVAAVLANTERLHHTYPSKDIGQMPRGAVLGALAAPSSSLATALIALSFLPSGVTTVAVLRLAAAAFVFAALAFALVGMRQRS